jgi:hypothetical protein
MNYFFLNNNRNLRKSLVKKVNANKKINPVVINKEQFNSNEIIQDLLKKHFMSSSSIETQSFNEPIIVDLDDKFYQDDNINISNFLLEEGRSKEYHIFKPLVKEETVLEEPVFEEPVLQEEVVEESVFEEPVLQEEVVVEEQVVVEEPVLQEEVLEKPVVVEEPVVDEEPVLQEEVVVEEPVLQEEIVVEEPVLQEEIVVEEPVLQEEVEKQPIVEETVLQEEVKENNKEEIVGEHNASMEYYDYQLMEIEINGIKSLAIHKILRTKYF